MCTSGDGSGFILGTCLCLSFLVYNSKINIPYYDICDQFCTIMIKGNKDISYIVIAALEFISNKQYGFVEEELATQGNDLKTYFINARNKRGWVQPGHLWGDRDLIIYKIIRIAIAEKNKHVKFLKSKKEVIIDIEDFLNIE